MQANDLITQVNSDEDENGHVDHLDASDSASGRQSFLSRFLSCFLCKAKQPPRMAGRGGGKQQSSLYSKHPTIPLQPQSGSQHGHGNSSGAGTAAISLTATNLAASSASSSKTAQLPLPQSAISLTSPSPPAVQMNGAPPSKYLLPPMSREEVAANRKTLVLDLDETLVHSSFKPIPNADFVLSIDLEGVIHRVYVRKRPGVDHFLRCCAEKFEVVVFTASLAKYADPLLDILDRDKTVRVRLFREACVQHYGNYVKDLTHLGRKLENCIIVDNSPFSYMFQPENAVPITSWFNDKSDRQLFDLLPHLDHLADCGDVIAMLAQKKLQFVNGQVMLGS